MASLGANEKTTAVRHMYSMVDAELERNVLLCVPVRDAHHKSILGVRPRERTCRSDGYCGRPYSCVQLPVSGLLYIANMSTSRQRNRWYSQSENT